MVKKLQLFFLFFVIILSSFSLGANYPAPFTDISSEEQGVFIVPCMHGGQCHPPNTISSVTDISTSLSSALASGASGAPARSDAYPLFTKSSQIYLSDSEREIANKREIKREIEDNWRNKSVSSGYDICKFTKGCLEADGCYPFGYVKEKQYCSSNGFIAQQSAGQCSYNFQCTSNLCFNNACADSLESLMANILKRISSIEQQVLSFNKLAINNNPTEKIIQPLETKPESRVGFFKRLFK